MLDDPTKLSKLTRVTSGYGGTYDPIVFEAKLAAVATHRTLVERAGMVLSGLARLPVTTALDNIVTIMVDDHHIG